MNLKIFKVESVKGQESLRSSKTKQDAKHYLLSSSSSSIKASRSPFIENAHREVRKISSSSSDLRKWTENFILIVELRRKIITFRSIIDLPPLTSYLSITNILMRTMKDLHKLCPKIVESTQILDMRREDVDKLLDHFYNVLKSIGDSWIDDHDWIIKTKYRNSKLKKKLSNRLVEKVLAALDGLIKKMNERLNNEEEKKMVSTRQSKTVLNPPSKVGDFAISVSNIPRNVRMQTLVKLSNNGDDESFAEKKSETEKVEKLDKAKEANLLEKISVKKEEIDDKNCSKVSEKSWPPTPIPPRNVAQPLPMATGKGLLPPSPGPPPPPLLGLGAKKATSKLKRSTKMGELYRFLKAKIEGKEPESRSRGSRSAIGRSSDSGKQGMADALAEITKKSDYFQKIEADVQMYMKDINELKTEISKFQSKDITNLQKFHKYVESVLDKLTDETKVLARCEGFPQSKLEAIRIAAALYSKLQGMIKELKNWKIESPANQLFDKTEHYFAKIRKEIETLDQTKVEEEKKLKSHNIHFDFNILTQIKELMVDISSSCMELALKEKREAKIASDTKLLWRAFQFAYKVYTFAGGHDDRADQLTKELANEIELIHETNDFT